MLQYLPSMLIQRLGGSDLTVLRVLILLSFASFAGVLWLMRASPGRASAKLVGEFLIFTSPLLVYSSSTFGEMTAALLALAFTLAALRGASWWLVSALMTLVGTTKDIAAPFLVVLGVIALAVARSPRAQRQLALGVPLGIVGALAMSAGFNYVRFGVPYNVLLMSDELKAPSYARPGFFFGLWLSPNGGLAFFWSSFVSLLAMVSAGVARSVLRRERSLRWAIPAIGVWIGLIGLTLGLSAWCAPFGWIAWGPRLLLPWVPSFAAVLLFCYSEVLDTQLSWISRRPALALPAALGLVALALPQFIALFDPWSFSGLVTAPDAVCPRIAFVQEGAAYYYRCMAHFMWSPSRLVLVTVWAELWRHVLWIVGVAAYVALLAVNLRSLGKLFASTE